MLSVTGTRVKSRTIDENRRNFTVLEVHPGVSDESLPTSYRSRLTMDALFEAHSNLIGRR